MEAANEKSIQSCSEILVHILNLFHGNQHLAQGPLLGNIRI